MSGFRNILPQALKIFNIVLLIALLPAAMLLLKDYFLYKSSSAKIEPVKIKGEAGQKITTIREYSPVVERGIFPSKRGKFMPLEVSVSSRRPAGRALETLKGLILIGTYVGPKEFAVISKTDRRMEKIFKKGDSVFGAGTLVGIHERGVDILVAGKTERLMLPLVKIPEAPPLNLKGKKEQGARVDGRGPANPSRKRKPVYSKKVGKDNWVIDRKAVTASLNNIGSVLTDARLTPVAKNGDIEGFLLTEIKPRGIFDALGLKNGDILKSVNGYPIDSPDKALQVLSALKGERTIKLDVVRNRVNRSFHYDIR